MTKHAIITLSINEAGTQHQGTFLFYVKVDGEVVYSNRNLSPENYKTVREISRRYNSMFEGGFAPRLAAEKLNAFGAELFSIWLAGSWENVKAKVTSGSLRLIVIASDVPDILNLPWELLRPPLGDFLGVDSKFSIRRFPRSGQEIPTFKGDLRPRPLRLLLAVSSPIDLLTLDFEREEEYLLRAISGLDVAFDSCDLGSFQDLRDHVEQFQPHIVHLTGHGAVIKKCPLCEWLNELNEAVCRKCSASLMDVSALGYFAFEDESGNADMRSSKELRRMLAASDVQCVFVSGCQTGKAPPTEALGGICQGLVDDEVPLSIGWAASISDDVANQFARSFYRTLAAGRPVDRALVQARQAVRETCEKRGDPSWTLPVLYSATDQGLVFDPDPRRPKEVPPRKIGPQRPLPGMIEGYAEHFVGRRREQQSLITALRDGSIQTVIITGLGGSGKSSLATRLAWKLEGDGFTPIAVPSSQEKPLSAARLIQTLSEAFLAADLDDAYQKLSNPHIPADVRLRYSIEILNKNRFLLVLDNFESNMDEAKRSILDQELAEFYEHLLANLTGSSRAIVSSRYTPAGKLPPKVREMPLGDFSDASFFKFLRRDDVVDARLRSGELSHDLLHEIHHLFGGTPRFLGQIRTVLRGISVEELKKELEAVKFPTDIENGDMQKNLDEYCEQIFTSRLYSYLSPESQRALSRAAVYGVAINFEGLEAVTGEISENLLGFVRAWQDHAFAYPNAERGGGELWVIYGLLRSWLLAQLSPVDRKAAHRAAGDFLSGLVNQKRSSDLNLFWADCLLLARMEYLQAEEYESTRKVTDSISVSFMQSGLYEGVKQLNRELLGKYNEHPSPMMWIGQAYYYQGNYEAAYEWTQSALAISQSICDKTEEGLAWHNLATIDMAKGDYKSAREKFQKALKIRKHIGKKAYVAETLNNLASIDLKEGNYKTAQRTFKKALKIVQQTENDVLQAAIRQNLASNYINIGKYEQSLDHLQKTMVLLKKQKHRYGEATCWHEMAMVNYHQNNYKKSLEMFKESLKIRQQIGDTAGEAFTLSNLGMMAANGGCAKEGLHLIILSSMIFGRIGHAEQKRIESLVNGLASHLKLTQEQFDDMRQEVAESYRRYGGWSLIEAAFVDVESPSAQE
ncbi:MAG: tetratricopeptide repeat protein [Methanothrix sp.]